MSLTLLTWPDERLALRCPPVTVGTLKEARGEAVLIEAYLLDANGVAGIAAPQLGIMRRICAVRLRDGRVLTMLNPTISQRVDEREVEPEACLSLPGEVWSVARSPKVRVQWADKRGARFSRTFSGWHARVIQHELDHLDGVLIRDVGAPFPEATAA